jgi:hypothetical protein
MVARQVGIAQRHGNIFMPHQLFNRWEIDPSHYQPASECMPEIMERKVWYARLRYSSLKGRAKGTVRLTIPIAETPVPLNPL